MEDALLGAAHRAALWWLARLGNRSRGLREYPRRPPADLAIAAAEIVYEHRRDADYVRVALALAAADDVADALAIAWDVFRAAAEDDLTTWEVTSASAQVQPELSLTGTGDSERENWPTRAGASSASERVPAL
jgi:hypothetical protein